MRNARSHPRTGCHNRPSGVRPHWSDGKPETRVHAKARRLAPLTTLSSWLRHLSSVRFSACFSCLWPPYHLYLTPVLPVSRAVPCHDLSVTLTPQSSPLESQYQPSRLTPHASRLTPHGSRFPTSSILLFCPSHPPPTVPPTQRPERRIPTSTHTSWPTWLSSAAATAPGGLARSFRTNDFADEKTAA